MELVILAFVLAALALYAYRRLGRLERILVFSRDYALPWYERGDFTFRLSFATESEAAAALAQVQGPGLATALELTPNGRWTAVWRIRARSSGRWYRELCERIVDAGRAQRLETITILASVTGPGGSSHVLLDNITFASTGAAQTAAL
jgi:hypothetical protein